MAYFNSSGGYNNFVTGERVPYVAPTAIYCDDCGSEEKGLVPYENMRSGNHRIQCRPWKWAPRYGGNTKCTQCGCAV